MSRRTERVGEELRAELARLMAREVTDPRVTLVTLTRVDVAPDFSNALVFWSHMTAQTEAELAQVEAGLASATGFLRHGLARALALRRIPQLHFRHDPSLALGQETLSLLRDLGDGEAGE
jgi:ribosome-binding factor A